MNEFYTNIVFKACANCGISFNSVFNVDSIVKRSLDGLTDTERLFITSIYPTWAKKNLEYENSALEKASITLLIPYVAGEKYRSNIHKKLLRLVTEILQNSNED